jgi:hypothetical protein
MALPGANAARRASKAIPLARLIVVGEVALMTGRDLQKLDVGERRRLASLVLGSARHLRGLSDHEREELHDLILKVEPRLLLGTAVSRFSPVPLPRRLLYGSTKRRRTGRGADA